MKSLKTIFFAIIIFLSSYSHANYLDRNEVHDFVDYLVKKHNFDKNYLLGIFSKTEKQQKIIDLMNNPSEKVTSWDRYKKRVSLTRIQNGVRFLTVYKKWFDKAEDVYGVPREVIASIIGLETNYGGYKGRTRVIDALTTAAFDYPRRRDFFRIQLEEYFLLTREEGFDPLEIKGSYAGAMGFVQFMPDNYRKLAVDFDGDGYVDLFNSVDDAIGSIANYLYVHGWKRNGKIVTKAYPNNVRKFYKPHESLTRFIPLTFNEDGKDLFFIGDDNFRAIAKYNISDVYAMAVYYLSEELKK